MLRCIRRHDKKNDVRKDAFSTESSKQHSHIDTTRSHAFQVWHGERRRNVARLRIIVYAIRTTAKQEEVHLKGANGMTIETCQIRSFAKTEIPTERALILFL